MAINPRNKGQFVQAATPHVVPKIGGSFLSVDGMVEFDTNYEQADYPVLYANIGNTYDDGTTGPTQFKTPTISEWGLPENKSDAFVGSTTINIYNKTIYSSAQVVGTITNGSDKEFLNIFLVDDAVDTGLDVVRIGVKDTYLNLTITSDISGDNVRLTITESGGIDTITFDYCVYPMPGNEDTKYMIRF